MTMQPKISVIVPVYKAENYLRRCIDSILAQTFTSFELILIDDGSPDNSGAICDEYAAKDSRIKVIHKENGGASDARNVGLDNAKGNKICFVDCDDNVDNNFLEIFNEKDADIVVQGLYRTKIAKDNVIEEYYAPIKDGYYNNVKDFFNIIYQADNIGYLPTRSFKREIIQKNNLRLNTEYKLREDMEFILRYMLECNTFATINKGAYHYDEPINFSQKYSGINQESKFLCMVSIIDNLQKMIDIPEKLAKQYLCVMSDCIINMYKTSTYDINKMNGYLKFFCKFYNKCSHYNNLSKKSKFIYYVIGAHTPKFMHRFYNRLLTCV